MTWTSWTVSRGSVFGCRGTTWETTLSVLFGESNRSEAKADTGNSNVPVQMIETSLVNSLKLSLMLVFVRELSDSTNPTLIGTKISSSLDETAVSQSQVIPMLVEFGTD
ncbi:MAG: hypothetical protein AAFQ41_12925 [Cyanobacteria bacterium J06623_7]